MIAKSWLSRCWQWQIGSCVVLVGVLCVGVSDRVKAQIVPDNTLGAESSVVTPNVNINGIQGDRIENGAIRGTNLFHSFSQFNIGEGRGAYFTNPLGIENILSRVTGANRSDILGRLGVDGDANLFLINPNGIVFGSDASLDVQGSFVATTANAIQFPNGEVFSASTPSAPSLLLIVNPSAFFFNQVPAGAIAHYSRTPVGTTPDGNQFGLRVPDGQSLLLVGGDIVMDGGGALARDGRIELGAIAGSGTVGLNVDGNDLSLSFPDGADRADISLSNGARVSVDGEGGGDIQVEGRRITLSGGSQIRTVTLGGKTGGTLAVTASESVEVIGESADGQIGSGLFATSRGSGEAGNLTIDTSRLLVRDGAQVSASTFAEGKGGSLQINASESVEVIGRSADGQFDSGLFASSEGSGEAGDLTIDTSRLLVRDGAQVSASTRGEGKGGSLQITAVDSIELIGETADGQFSSALVTQSEGSGKAGTLMINTSRLLVRDGAQVSASTFAEGKGGNLLITAADSVEVIGRSADGQFPSGLFTQSEGSGDAGELRIDTERLLVRDGAVVSASTFAEGKGGSLQINASESVEVIGESADGQFGSGLFASSEGSGEAGDLTIVTPRLLVRDGAVISSQSFGDGTAGDINIKAHDTLQVDNGTIRTNSTQSSGGAITINAGDIHLFGDSDIISNVASGAGGGGNIKLTADSILAFDDSDILAFADDGSGGDVTLNTPAFFGENYRPAPRNTDPDTLENNNQVDINVTGTISGVITITSDTSFIQNSLTELPDNQIDTDSLLANSCIVRRNQPTQGSFMITGTGGLPQRPGDAQMSSYPTVDIETLPTDSTPSNTNPNRPWQKGDLIIEPQGVYRLPNGNLVLSRECP
jgi:filamentous hemagglutinin family protein